MQMISPTSSLVYPIRGWLDKESLGGGLQPGLGGTTGREKKSILEES